MLAFVVSPTTGREVSRGVLGTKDLDAPKGAGLVSARKGALPVAVGPRNRLAMAFIAVMGLQKRTSKDLWSGLKILGHLAGGGARGGSGCSPPKPGCMGEAERRQQDENGSNHYECDGFGF